MAGCFNNDENVTDNDQSSVTSRDLPPQWKSSSIKMKRRDQVQALMGQVPEASVRLLNEMEVIQINNRTYQLLVVEQPQQCRISSFGDKDRRLLDPAPIVQLIIKEKKMTSVSLTKNPSMSSNNPFYVIHASLWSVDMKEKCDIAQPSSTTASMTRVLGGTVSSSSYYLRDLDGMHGLYFSFPDLSVCMTGQYRLKFDLVHLAKSTIITRVFSEPFTAYTAKTFPGMKESTALSKHLARQGLKLPVRNQTRSKTDASKEP